MADPSPPQDPSIVHSEYGLTKSGVENLLGSLHLQSMEESSLTTPLKPDRNSDPSEVSHLNKTKQLTGASNDY